MFQHKRTLRTREIYDSCAETVINLLKKRVPDKECSKADITRGHRLGSSKNQASDSGSSRNRPRPMIVKFAHWGDKLHVLTKGKEGLKREGIAVAGDLTSRQQGVIRQYRSEGVRAYYKGNKLAVGERFPPRTPLPVQHEHNRADTSSGSGGGLREGRGSDHSLPVKHTSLIQHTSIWKPDRISTL
ncbi:hypothetical protein ACOMHN_064097 [Nucella lapillus]